MTDELKPEWKTPTMADYPECDHCGCYDAQKDRLEKALAFISLVAKPNVRKFTQEYGDVAEQLLKELDDA